MGRLDMFTNNDIIEKKFNYYLTTLGFKEGYLPSSEELDYAFNNRKIDGIDGNGISEIYNYLKTAPYRYERIFERIQRQYLAKQYNILNRYYIELQKGLISNKEILDSIEKEYANCINDIRNIDIEVGIIEDLINSNGDYKVINGLLDSLEKRELDIDANNIDTSVKLDEIKKKISQLYSKTKGTERSYIRELYGNMRKSLIDITLTFPNTKNIIEDYLNNIHNKMYNEEIDIYSIKRIINNMAGIVNVLTASNKSSMPLNRNSLLDRYKKIANKLSYSLNLENYNLLLVGENNTQLLSTEDYINGKAKNKESLSMLTSDRGNYELLTAIIEGMLNKINLSNSDLIYINGVINNLETIVNTMNKESVNKCVSMIGIDKFSELPNSFILLLNSESEEKKLDNLEREKEKTIFTNLVMDYTRLISEIGNYYNSNNITVKKQGVLDSLLMSTKSILKDNSCSIEMKNKAVRRLEGIVNSYFKEEKLHRYK